MSQLREVVQAREATIAHLHSEQHHASVMLEAVRAERDRLQHEVRFCQSPGCCLTASVAAQVTACLSMLLPIYTSLLEC